MIELFQKGIGKLPMVIDGRGNFTTNLWLFVGVGQPDHFSFSPVVVWYETLGRRIKFSPHVWIWKMENGNGILRFRSGIQINYQRVIEAIVATNV